MDTSDFKNGISIIVDGEIWTIIEFQHVKPGKGPAFVRSKLKNLLNGKVVEKTWRAGERMDQAFLERGELTYSYSEGDELFFMDEDYELKSIPAETVGDGVKYLQEGLQVTAVYHEGSLLSVELPLNITSVVTETGPDEKGNTATGGTKPATIETGAVVNVPMFIHVGDKIKVDTRTNEYVERVKD